MFGDLCCWPVRLWTSGLLDLVPAGIDHAVLAAASGLGRNGWGGALLMDDDVGPWLVPEGHARVPAEAHLALLDDMAALHARFWGFQDTIGLLPLASRFHLSSDAMIVTERALAFPSTVPPIARDGWNRLATVRHRAVPALFELRRDPGPLVAALDAAPQTLVQGDWKMGNLGRRPDGRTILLDWAFPGRAPPTIDLAWHVCERAALPDPVTPGLRRGVTPHPYDRDVPIHTTAVPYGASALDALAAAVRAAKGDDPLVPVTIVVPTNTAGVMARRALGRRGGATAIDVAHGLSPRRAARVLIAARRRPQAGVHAGRRPRRQAGAARLAGSLSRRRRAPLHRRRPARSLPRAPPRRSRRAHRARPYRPRAASPPGSPASSPDSSLPAGTTRATSWPAPPSGRVDELPARLSRSVVYLPERLRPLEIDLLRALGETSDVELVVGLTGDAAADASVVDLVRDLTGSVPPTLPARPAAGVIDVVSTTDADDEVRAAVRAVLDGARAGVPFDRMAVLWPVDHPYARLVQHHLVAAEIPWNGRPGTGTGERAVPRVLAELLELDRRGLRRSDLMALLGDVPARGADGRRVPTARWERIGRRAGIVRDEDWDTRLPPYIAEAGERGIERSRRRRGLARLRRRPPPPPRRPRRRPRRWDEWVSWSHEQLEAWFGAAPLARLSDEEQEAYQRTQRVLDRLRHLDSIGPPVDRAEFRATFVAELDVTPARRGTVGDGVHVGLLAGSRGLDVDLVVVLGAVEGLLPPPPSIDPLLGDDERQAAGLAGSAERAAVAHRQFLAAVTTTGRVLVTVPRGDLRATTEYHPYAVAGRHGRPR